MPLTTLLCCITLNMFRAPLCPSSGAHDDSVGYHIRRLVLELLRVTSNQQELENQTAYVVTNAIVVSS